MDFSDRIHGLEAAIPDLFTTTFTASEGPDEGALDRRRSSRGSCPRWRTIKLRRLHRAGRTGSLSALSPFTPLTYPDPPPERGEGLMLLSPPMAVAPRSAGRGEWDRPGAFIAHALARLRGEGTDISRHLLATRPFTGKPASPP